MKTDPWQRLVLQTHQESAWELFHENSKTSAFKPLPPDEEVLGAMAVMWQSLPYQSFPATPLPETLAPLNCQLEQAILNRCSARELFPIRHSLAELNRLLFSGYGLTRTNIGTGYPRPFRVVPSGGAMYPLEIFFYSASIDGLEAGVYHYNPVEAAVRRVRDGDSSDLLNGMVVQHELVSNASLLIFITAVFERSTFKYGDRGYRFALLEAGHVAQNINLVANGLGLSCVNIGGFFDRRVDEFLDLDGLTHSTIYMIALGGRTASLNPE